MVGDGAGSCDTDNHHGALLFSHQYKAAHLQVLQHEHRLLSMLTACCYGERTPCHMSLL